jgi:membrane protease YdiL (CAAX protease family)
MTAWEAFAGVAAFVTLALLALARASATVVDDDAALSPAGDAIPPLALLVNLALSQGVLAAVLVGGAWFTGVPPSAVGLGAGTRGTAALLAGVALGVALYLGDELLALAADRAGAGYSERLRDLLAPATASGWVVLLGVALPVVAGFEELLFRGVLVGAMAAGFGVSPWALAVASSALFGVAHGAQGVGGMLVTGALGFALAAAFLLTDSLPVVVVAHYLVNALEFLVRGKLRPQFEL